MIFSEQRENERAATLGIGNIAMSASFFTPPSRPLQPPTTPRKKKADKKFLKVIESPSFFPETTVQSHAVKLGSPGKYESFSPRNSTNASSMVLRSSSKPRRSTRIKSKYNYFYSLTSSLKSNCYFYYKIFIFSILGFIFNINRQYFRNAESL